MDELAAISSDMSFSRCWHWAVMLAVLVVGWAVYLLWFVPPSEYDSEVPPGQYNSWFWILGTVVVVAVAIFVENRKKCFPGAQN